MKSKSTEESNDDNQFIKILKGEWDTVYIAVSLLLAFFVLGPTFVSANAQTPQGNISSSVVVFN
jgi:hypothetical protein